MTIMDDFLEMCDAVALNTGGAASYLIGDVIDLGTASPGPGVGTGEPMYWVVTVDTAVTATGSGTYQFTLASDAQAAIATDGSATVHLQTAAIPKATLVAGYVVIAAALPLGTPAYERYLGTLQTTAVSAATAGKVNSFLTHDVGRWRAYAQGAL
jgi:hypothetical protein